MRQEQRDVATASRPQTVHAPRTGDPMDACCATRTQAVAVLTGRRTVVVALMAAGLAFARDPAKILAQEATPSSQPLFTGETFVGETSDPETIVAIVLGEVAGAEPRAARAYLCNGLLRTIDVWFLGEADGDQLTLAAEDGSQLSGVLNAAGIGGGATLPDGRGLLFTALPATGLAGLYTVAMLPDGRMAGESASGGTLGGALAADDVQDGERFPYDVLVTTPEGETAPLTISTATNEEAEFRTILLSDGRGQGQGKTKRTRDWTDPTPEP